MWFIGIQILLHSSLVIFVLGESWFKFFVLLTHLFLHWVSDSHVLLLLPGQLTRLFSENKFSVIPKFTPAIGIFVDPISDFLALGWTSFDTGYFDRSFVVEDLGWRRNCLGRAEFIFVLLLLLMFDFPENVIVKSDVLFLLSLWIFQGI